MFENAYVKFPKIDIKSYMIGDSDSDIEALAKQCI